MKKLRVWMMLALALCSALAYGQASRATEYQGLSVDLVEATDPHSDRSGP